MSNETIGLPKKAAVVTAIAVTVLAGLARSGEFVNSVIDTGKKHEAVTKTYSEEGLLENRQENGLKEGEVIVKSDADDTTVGEFVGNLGLSGVQEDRVEDEVAGQVGGLNSFDGGDAAVLPENQLKMSELSPDANAEPIPGQAGTATQQYVVNK